METRTIPRTGLTVSAIGFGGAPLGDLYEAMDGAYRALDRLRAEHVVNAIGIGVNEAEMCERFARAGEFDVMMLAGRYTLLEQGALEGFLTLAVEKRIGVLFAGVFNSGIL